MQIFLAGGTGSRRRLRGCRYGAEVSWVPARRGGCAGTFFRNICAGLIRRGVFEGSVRPCSLVYLRFSEAVALLSVHRGGCVRGGWAWRLCSCWEGSAAPVPDFWAGGEQSRPYVEGVAWCKGVFQRYSVAAVRGKANCPEPEGKGRRAEADRW